MESTKSYSCLSNLIFSKSIRASWQVKQVLFQYFFWRKPSSRYLYWAFCSRRKILISPFDHKKKKEKKIPLYSNIFQLDWVMSNNVFLAVSMLVGICWSLHATSYPLYVCMDITTVHAFTHLHKDREKLALQLEWPEDPKWINCSGSNCNPRSITDPNP